MEKTPRGTAVGVDDPYEQVDGCDHLTDDGRCRFAVERPERDPAFARERAAEEYACVVDAPEGSPPTPAAFDWETCPHFRCRDRDRECARCGLEEKRIAHSDERPLLEEHHLSYPGADGDELSHEITVYLCRWCHAKIHDSWARITDDVAPDPEAIAALEARRSRELEEFGFESAADRHRSE